MSEGWTDKALRALDRLRQRKRNYELAFMTPAGQDVLIDLARFCRANETCFHPDARVHAATEGRREVWLRIQQHINLNSQQLFTLYQGQHLLTNQEKDK